jgi:hypothetical protein
MVLRFFLLALFSIISSGVFGALAYLIHPFIGMFVYGFFQTVGMVYALSASRL